MPDRDTQDVVIDRDQVNNASGVVSAGPHLMRITDVQLARSQGGNEYLNWRLEVVGSQDPDQGKSMLHMTSLLPQAAWRFQQFLDACGSPQTGKFRATSLIGKMLRVEVVHDPYTNEETGITTNRPKLGAMMPANAAEVQASSGAKPAATGTVRGASNKGSDEVPF